MKNKLLDIYYTYIKIKKNIKIIIKYKHQEKKKN